jgi:hypothetical protein
VRGSQAAIATRRRASNSNGCVPNSELATRAARFGRSLIFATSSASVFLTGTSGTACRRADALRLAPDPSEHGSIGEGQPSGRYANSSDAQGDTDRNQQQRTNLDALGGILEIFSGY